jgi:hypothetical protein
MQIITKYFLLILYNNNFKAIYNDTINKKTIEIHKDLIKDNAQNLSLNSTDNNEYQYIILILGLIIFLGFLLLGIFLYNQSK